MSKTTSRLVTGHCCHKFVVLKGLLCRTPLHSHPGMSELFKRWFPSARPGPGGAGRLRCWPRRSICTESVIQGHQAVRVIVRGTKIRMPQAHLWPPRPRPRSDHDASDSTMMIMMMLGMSHGRRAGEPPSQWGRLSARPRHLSPQASLQVALWLHSQ